MTKPKIVCVVGSAVLAPLTIAAISLTVGALAFVLLPPPFRAPMWLIDILLVFACFAIPLGVRDLYRWYFGRCYRPPNAVTVRQEEQP